MAKSQDYIKAALNRLIERTANNELLMQENGKVILMSELAPWDQSPRERMIIGIGDENSQIEFYSNGSEEDHAGIFLHLQTFAGEGIEH